MSVVGIDLGNLNAVIAAARQGGIEVLTNEYTYRLTPYVLSFYERITQFMCYLAIVTVGDMRSLRSFCLRSACVTKIHVLLFAFRYHVVASFLQDHDLHGCQATLHR